MDYDTQTRIINEDDMDGDEEDELLTEGDEEDEDTETEEEGF